MGIPKFFRYISERYPLTSQLIEENKIPEFDNLYLDFNGIIHNCSHPQDEDAHFRLTEEQIFTAIFTYVDHLFGKIKPKKLFFMAVDGVAPRAKMNQQRSRRFRTAKEAKEVREKALRNGEELPAAKAFDSNCITPGTLFMTKLSAQLRYFVNKKITEDAAWREVEVVLSGHEVPGEGEHKIMEYIRLSKAQPDYNPNVRHCLYGLDADLVMLGLLSHDPHFCLLREEVKFGPARKKGATSLEHQNFFLLHISLLREYLDLEFRDIEPALSFPYNLERIIDDFILFAVFVGNDFLPHLPDLHIHENGLEKLFDIYKRVLPGMDGYLNESGFIHTQRLQVVLDELALTEKESFERENMDMNWFKGKQSKHMKAIEQARKKGPQTLTKPQQDLFRKIQDFVLSNRQTPSSQLRLARLTFPNMFPARDRTFINKLAEDLHLSLAWDEYEDEENVVTFRFPTAALDPASKDEDDTDDGEWEDEDEEAEAEANSAVDRVLKKYNQMQVIQDDEYEDEDERYEKRVAERMYQWKKSYYQEKLEMNYNDPQHLHQLVYRYVEGLQWVMHYYFSGVASWGWFYDYHYAPRISDLKRVDEMHFQFTLGTPFRPFEQLMGVLPEASKDLIPLAYRELMYDSNSPIIDFYPQEFVQDQNGKKQEWEAIVKIPFINEERLLRAMASREHRLIADERQRNSFGTSTRFVYDASLSTTYPSSLPGFFPAIYRCQCAMEPFDLPSLDGLHLVEGLCDGVFLGSSALAGFPSMKTLPHTGQLGYHSVNVFQSESRNKSMVVHIDNRFEDRKTEDIAQEMVGKRTFIGWPFLQEGLVVAVSDNLFRHEKVAFGRGQEKVLATPHGQDALYSWRRKAERIEHVYSKRFGVIIGSTDVLVHVRPLKGLRRLDSGALVKDYEGQEKETEQAVQMTLTDVESEDPRYLEKDAPPLHEEFPQGSKIFFLGEHAYGVAAQVSDTTETTLSVILAFFPSENTENEKFTKLVSTRPAIPYFPSYRVSEMLGMSSLALARITSSFLVITSDAQKTNLGLSLKFEAKGMKVLDYSQKPANGRGWEFSEKAINLLRDYKDKFPQVFSKLDTRGDNMVEASDMFPEGTGDSQIKEIRTWLNAQGVRDFDPVSLFCDQLKKETVAEIEKVADGFNANKSPSSIKKAIVKGIPRQAVLKPSHAVYRLQNQAFSLGDRVIMVQDSGGVPLCAKGVVVGLNNTSMDVVWDVPFLSGTNLGGRCSEYRGSTCTFDSCLNLTHPQFVMSTRNQQTSPTTRFQPRIGPHPAVRGRGGQHAAGLRVAPPPSGAVSSMKIMANPHRGRGGSSSLPNEGSSRRSSQSENVANGHINRPPGPQHHVPEATHSRGGLGHPHPRGGFAFNPALARGGGPFRGRGGFGPSFAPPFTGRGGAQPRGFRGRGRGGGPHAPAASVQS